jgi:hypothetical protein
VKALLLVLIGVLFAICLQCLAAFCNLTITALHGPPLASTPLTNTPSASPMTPGSSGSGHGGGLFTLPLTLHPQVSFRLVRVLTILSRKFLALQVRHEGQITAHNARVEMLQNSGRATLTEEEEKAELELEEVAEELGTCMEFIQLLLEVVNHSIVHALPPLNPLAPPSIVAAHRALVTGSDGKPYQSSLASNPHLLYNLLAAREYFSQLLPYSHLFEANLISNLTNTIAFYEQAPGVVLSASPNGSQPMRSGVLSPARGRVSEKDIEKSVQALSKAVGHTPMSNLPMSPLASPAAKAKAQVAAASAAFHHALPPASCPDFNPAALIERGPFTYHEQENSQDFFLPYIYQVR